MAGAGERGLRGFAELTLETDDLAAMEAFYIGLLGAELLAREGDRVWLTVGEYARLGLWCPGAKEHGDRGGRHVHFALSVTAAGIDEVIERLAAAGVRAKGPVRHEGGDRSLYIRDPAGNVVELWDVFDRPDGARRGVRSLR